VRRFVILLSCIFLTVAVAGQAPAAPSRQRTAPSAPTSVAVAPLAATTATVTWKSPISPGSAKVLGYKVITKAENRRLPVLDLAPATARSKVVKNLEAGITYTISVVAFSSAGLSPAAAVKYTAPSPTRQFLFAFDTTAKAIVKVPVTGGAAVTVATGFGTNPIRFDVDKPGNTYILDTVTKRVTKVPADGKPSTTLRSGLTAPTDLQIDAAGRVYVLSGTTVIRLAGTGSPEKVIGMSPDGFAADAMFVAADGTVSLLSRLDVEVNLTTIPANGGPATSRSIGAGYEGSRYLGMIGDQVGTVYLNVASSGVSGYVGWTKVAVGSVNQVDATTKLAEYTATVGPDNQFYLLQTTVWCAGMSQYFPDQNGNLCVPDQSVPEVLTLTPTGSRTSVAVQGLTLGPVVVDSAGNIYVALSTQIVRYPPTGGAPTVLATGTFALPATNG
jgi:hypothetical protein